MTDEHITPSPAPIAAEAAPVIEHVAEEPSVDVVAAPAEAPASDVEKRGGTPLWLTLVLVAALAVEPVALHKLLPPSPQAAGSGDQTAALQRALDAATTRLDALEAVHPPAQTDASRMAALESRLETLERQPAPVLPDVSAQIEAASAALNARIADLDTQIQKDVAQATARAAFANRLRAASGALEAGQPIGDIDGAPPELARFATIAPPTEPALRLAFPTYADAARAASQPDVPGEDAVARAMQRVQALVTVRQGDKVLVGSRAAVVLEEARGKLDAGDLAGAVTSLGKLDKAALAAFGPWLSDAQALLDARAALLALVAKS